jgi:hypothetical protein
MPNQSESEYLSPRHHRPARAEGAVSMTPDQFLLEYWKQYRAYMGSAKAAAVSTGYGLLARCHRIPSRPTGTPHPRSTRLHWPSSLSLALR